MHRLLTAMGLALSVGAAAIAEPGETEGSGVPVGDAAAPRTVDELAVILEERVSLLEAILGIQAELLALAQRDADAAFLARPPMAQCVLALPELWCRQLTATFRPGSAP
ncbi:MAG: hypothetical protein OXF40_10500 [Rhodospirillales bacterium]|nr:hypothetical protein [Rhodospirillales bacterium]